MKTATQQDWEMAVDIEAAQLGGRALLQLIVGADDPRKPWRCAIESPRLNAEAMAETREDAARKVAELCKEIRRHV